MECVVENITVFLESAGLCKLMKLGIINGEKLILTGASVAPLMAFMEQKGVFRLEFGEDWSLESGGVFVNRYGGNDEPVKLTSVSSMGEVFRGANRRINPFYCKKPGGLNPSGRPERPDSPARAFRATDLERAGEMNDMINSLPLNRKERYWTSCVFPNIVCGGRFNRLSIFLKMAGVPDKFIKTEYSNSDICFYTEYSLKESALDWREVWHIKRDTPDIVILLRAACGEKFLVVVEAKMYDYVTASDLAAQMRRQMPVINTIMERNAMPPENFAHVGLILSPTAEFEAGLLAELTGAPRGEGRAPDYEEGLRPAGCNPLRVRLIGWKDILDAYRECEGDYFYEMLKVACANPQLAVTLEAYLKRKPVGGRR